MGTQKQVIAIDWQLCSPAEDAGDNKTQKENKN